MNEVEHHYGEAGRHEPGASSRKSNSPAGAVRDRVGKAYEGASEWTRGRYDEASDWASGRLDDASRKATYARRRSAIGVGRARQTIEQLVDENPIMIGVVGLAAGLLVGALLPTTRREKRLLGPYADEARDQGLRYARDLAEQGRHFVEESLERLPDVARPSNAREPGRP